MAVESITITKPDDWHVHLRDGEMLEQVSQFTAHLFGRAIIMPNLKIPITTMALATAYRDRILQVTQEYIDFEPLVTAYLTDTFDPHELITGHAAGVFLPCERHHQFGSWCQ